MPRLNRCSCRKCTLLASHHATARWYMTRFRNTRTPRSLFDALIEISERQRVVAFDTVVNGLVLYAFVSNEEYVQCMLEDYVNGA